MDMRKKHTAGALFDATKETVPVGTLRVLQLKKLQEAVAFAAERSVFYQGKKKLSRETRFNSFEEFAERVPFTTKEELVASEPYENLCVDRRDVIEVHFSSGTSARPVHSFLTRKDIAEGSEYLARTWYMQGVRRESVFGMLASYGLFSAGLLNQYAIQRIGAFVIPIGGSSVDKTLDLFQRFGVDSCAAVASYYPYFITVAREKNVAIDMRLLHVIAGGEPFSENQRMYVERALGATMYDQYGLCEINTGLAGECGEKNGLHILADYAYPEIIDPETGVPLAEGLEGELVLTTFYKEASPLVRYRTGDLTSISYEPCACGRTMPRVARIKRRVTEVLFYKGIKIEKSFVGALMEKLQDVVNPYLWQLEVTAEHGRDHLVMKVVAHEKRDSILEFVSSHLRERFGFTVVVRAFSSDERARLGTTKLKNFLDSRTEPQ